jgi:transcriptional regulator GlxA family with amidase domain
MQIFILGFNQTFASSLLGLMDIFQQAEQLVEQLVEAGAGCPTTAKVKVGLVSMDGKPIRCQNNIVLNVHCAVEEIQKVDMFIISSIPDPKVSIPGQDILVNWLQQQHRQGTVLVSICTGAFLLARTRLLDGKEATTHWSVADRFRSMFPAVRLCPEKLIVNHGDLYCAAGAGAASDLAYYLLEIHFGHPVAARTAKFFVHDFRRPSQAAYAIYGSRTRHNDSQVLKAQLWIKKHLAGLLNVDDLADIAGLGRRTFERRFKAATGETPQAYIQQLKVETAKQMIETTNRSFSQISYDLGYNNPGSFRKVFINRTGILPSRYREKFSAYVKDLPS